MGRTLIVMLPFKEVGRDITKVCEIVFPIPSTLTYLLKMVIVGVGGMLFSIGFFIPIMIG